MHLMIMHWFFLHLQRLFTDASALVRGGVIAFLLSFLSGGGALADSTCVDLTTVGKTPVTIASISERAELMLTDGRTIRLSGLAFFDEARAASAMRDIVHETSASLPLISSSTDRWGRYSGQIAIIRDGRTELLAESLVEHGVALMRSDDALSFGGGRRASSVLSAAACLKRLEVLEAEARRGKRGIWGEPYALPIETNDSHRLLQLEGQFIVVSGKVISIGERRAMTFLNFGHSWRRDFSVMIARDEWDKMVREGISAQTLINKRVLVRGNLLVRENALGQKNMEAGIAPLIRLSGARNISIMDTD
ncbi:thermonuclease family protein [Pseudochelatococcus sp. G4_1912]|uniref:thermonuclease family protein n=1 Tax=Pseudochelatococcus sp. G4_1912 TaxID=3114288 RepID=UPI0039C6EA70